ncbi:UDP-N-acetylmuramoyl-L-alanine--D-glutamate ligase [Pantanalinema sp. GBBB05]|uniref:UDP-N-acetylmuramoyl-L-alanine--D-glutamate ligase n=1 Tax=Pantanalinema sp. GBBB05 TaxID=2604139 RepID=UPI001D77E420|nr:UDP-N-acetylmuramoyl-L-alanine--D-glutamate ligase [Pantanalinema sp. GBBB05]
MKACVIGLGKSGVAAARLLKREGWQVTVSDRGNSTDLQRQQQELAADGIRVELGDAFNPELDSPKLVVVSPGVPWDIPGLQQARSLGIETIGEMELAWRHLQDIPWVTVTGTNGKTTTTALIAAIFQAAGLDAPAFGNIGYAACEVALLAQKPDWAIAELSSYQIEASPSVAPKIAVWTTFTPDHLSRHKTLERYYNIKAHLLHQAQYQVFNGDDPYLRNVGKLLAAPVRAEACWTSVKGKADLIGNPELGVYIEDAWVRTAQELILPANLLKMPGRHNQQNLLMAVAAARLAGIDKAAIAQAIASFPGVPHRLEHICTWQGVDYINDSKATNYDAAQVGLASVNSPAILIAGGEAKIGDDSLWIDTIREKAAAVLLIGNAAPSFAQRLQESSYSNYEIVETMERAVQRSPELAKQTNASVVLLSPACASFDQYQNFEQRGDHFRQLCQMLGQ